MRDIFQTGEPYQTGQRTQTLWERCVASYCSDSSIFPIFVSCEQPQRKLLICLGVKHCPCSLYIFCNLLWSGHLEPLRTCLLELVHHHGGEDICILHYICSLKCAANKKLPMKSSEDCVFLKKIFTLSGLYLFEPLILSLCFPFSADTHLFPTLSQLHLKPPGADGAFKV